jgi:glucosamine--fructose-6-phosphate aminotransferase (isomerizing)
MSTTITDQEIRQQPAVIRRLLEREQEAVQQIAATLGGRFDHVLIAARGTSDNAARYAKYLLGAHNRLPVSLATPSLYTLYHRPPQLERTLVAGISQSGQSPDIVSVVQEGRRQGQPTLAITNDPESRLAKVAEYIIPLHAGPERAVAATKTYTASLAALALFSLALENDSARLDQLHEIPETMDAALATLHPLMARVERYRYIKHCVVIGRGFNYSTAFEVALKIKELTRTVAEPYSSADFRHGPIAMLDPGFPVFVISPLGAIHGDMGELVSTLATKSAELLIVSDDPALLDQAHLPLPLPAGLPEWLTPLVTVLAGQLFSLTLAQEKGLDPDRPEGLTKVTETW